ncbi:MAG: hypothetical protein AAF721_33975 [Myxococcota bacterium]
MSAAEIADNKWELSSTKAPVGSASGIAQILLMGGFAVFFVWIIVFSIIAIVTPKAEDGGLAGQYQNMGVDGAEGGGEAKPEE